MYEEPYRWVEAIDHRRQYLVDQLKHGGPIVGVSCSDGVLLLTFSQGTPKLYEIYDRLACGGMGHPADLEKLRFHLLDLAHVEGFQRSPADVTGARLVKYGLAPIMKQSFEEIFKAPYIAKILLAEVGRCQTQDHFLRIEYDGAFEESAECAAVAATSEAQELIVAYLSRHTSEIRQSLGSAIKTAMYAWSVGTLRQQEDNLSAGQAGRKESHHGEETANLHPLEYPDEPRIIDHLRKTQTSKTLECALLDRTIPGTSKYRMLRRDDVLPLLPQALVDVR